MMYAARSYRVAPPPLPPVAPLRLSGEIDPVEILTILALFSGAVLGTLTAAAVPCKMKRTRRAAQVVGLGSIGVGALLVAGAGR